MTSIEKQAYAIVPYHTTVITFSDGVTYDFFPHEDVRLVTVVDPTQINGLPFLGNAGVLSLTGPGPWYLLVLDMDLPIRLLTWEEFDDFHAKKRDALETYLEANTWVKGVTYTDGLAIRAFSEKRAAAARPRLFADIFDTMIWSEPATLAKYRLNVPLVGSDIEKLVEFESRLPASTQIILHAEVDYYISVQSCNHDLKGKRISASFNGRYVGVGHLF